MLKNCIFHKSVIPLILLTFGIASDIECLYTIIFSLVSIFQSFWKNLIFSKKCDIFDFGGLFTALQFSICTKGLYKMNKNSI